jgi:hypothetical protein
MGVEITTGEGVQGSSAVSHADSFHQFLQMNFTRSFILGERSRIRGEVNRLLFRFWGSAGFKEPDKFREVWCAYVGHGPELEAATGPPHDVVALLGRDGLG